MTGMNPRRRAVADAPLLPWVVVAPDGVHWLGHAATEADAWRVALGWPDAAEIAEHKQLGWYAAEATVKWQRPNGVPEAGPNDTERLEWLTRHVSGKALREAGVSWPAWSLDNARAAIDAARNAGVASGGDTGPFLGPDEVCAPHGNVIPCEACFADGVPASGTETMRTEYRREDLGDGVRGRCPNCLDTGYIAGDTDQPCGCEAGRSAKSEVDWGAVDDELLDILRRADPRLDVHSSVMVSALRALLRKVSGQ